MCLVFAAAESRVRGVFSCSPARVLVGKVIEEGRKEEEGGKMVREEAADDRTSQHLMSYTPLA